MMRLALGTLLAIVCAASANAHTQSGSLGSGADATDYYHVTCFDDGAGAPTSLRVELRDDGPQGAPILNAQVTREGLFGNASDPDDTDNDYGPSIYLNGGAGVYKVLIDKTGSGSVNYRLSYHCYTGPDGTGAHTGTFISTRQNQ